VVLNAELGTQMVKFAMQFALEEAFSWGCHIEWEEEVAMATGEVIMLGKKFEEGKHMTNDSLHLYLCTLLRWWIIPSQWERILIKRRLICNFSSRYRGEVANFSYKVEQLDHKITMLLALCSHLANTEQAAEMKPLVIVNPRLANSIVDMSHGLPS
jgi:hypothetical protein